MNSKTELGLTIFEQWLGYPIAEKKLLETQFKVELEQISDSLFTPPSENLIVPSDKYSAPWVDALFFRISKEIGVAPRDFWPNRAPYAVCLTHDIDRVFSTVQRLKHGAGISEVLSDCLSLRSDELRKQNVFFNFSRLSEMLNEFKIKSALYVLLEKRRWLKALKSREPQHVIGVYGLEDVAQELVKLNVLGCEIGIHGSFDSWNNPQYLQNEVALLHAAGIPKIWGGRNHYLQFDPDKTLAAYESAGFCYDSTMGFNFISGFRSGTSFPFLWKNIVEIPLHLMDTALWYEYSSQAQRIIQATNSLAQVRKFGGLLMVNWHLQYVNKGAFEERYSVFTKILKQAISDGAWICLPHQAAQHWIGRAFFRSI